ncbi:MAG: hypothetical protein DRG11_06550 [Epsilonproteobacteria bacterium]|nr:MAG: hypothetical protein DRG11_06550 [Campylobacterota bacterium]
MFDYIAVFVKIKYAIKCFFYIFAWYTYITSCMNWRDKMPVYFCHFFSKHFLIKISLDVKTDIY